MTAGLPALRNYDIDTRFDGALGVRSRSDGVHHHRACFLCARHQVKVLTPEKGNHRNALLETDFEALFLRKLKIQVDPEWARGQSAHFPDLTPDRLVVRAPEHEHAEGAGIAYGGRECGTNRAAHRGLNDRHLDSKSCAKSGLHAMCPGRHYSEL